MINVLIIILLVFLVFCLLMFFIQRNNRERHTIQNRMAQFSGLESSLQNVDNSPQELKPQTDFKDKFLNFIKHWGEQLANFQKSNSFALKMQQADIPLLGSEFQIVLIIAAILGGSFMFLLTLKATFALVGVLGALVFCLVGLSFRISRRRKAFDNQLGDMLTMIANALRAGFSFMQALEHIANEMDDPVRSEIHKVVRDVNIGVTLESALENMNHRICSKDFELVVAAVLIQRQVGGNLAQILDSISETINDRIRMRREVQALTAQGRLSGFIMALLPLVMGAFLQVINPQYMDPLFSEPIGRMALGLAVVLVILAFVVIRRIVDIDI